jgi:hypothetical protein
MQAGTSLHRGSAEEHGRGTSLRGSSMRGPYREGSFTGEPEGCAKYGSGNGRLFSQRSRFREHGGTLLF